MDRSDESTASLRWFIDTMLTLREELDAEQFERLAAWIEFVADEQIVAH